MKAPTKIRIDERPTPQPSGVREMQIKALRYWREHTPSAAEFQQATVTLIAMGEQP
jgi:hypothetical protein